MSRRLLAKRLPKAFLAGTLFTVFVAAIPSSASGRVYARDQIGVCRALADLKGVYAVYTQRDDLARKRIYDLALNAGFPAKSVVNPARDLLRGEVCERGIDEVDIDVYTYRDPMQSSDFRRTFDAGEYIKSVYGFPDYRAAEVCEIHGLYKADGKSDKASWSVYTRSTDPALSRDGN